MKKGNSGFSAWKKGRLLKKKDYSVATYDSISSLGTVTRNYKKKTVLVKCINKEQCDLVASYANDALKKKAREEIMERLKKERSAAE